MRLANKVAVITGGAAGIGLATTELFLKEGASVAIWDVTPSGKELADKLLAEGYKVWFQQVSVTDREDLTDAATETIARFGKIDILINNAGITKDKTLLKMGQDDWDQVLAVNLTGVFNCTQIVAEHMKQRGYGRIVSASSNVGLRGNYGQTNYVATKSAIIGMTKVWALELGRFGITANCIAPGFIETQMTQAIPEEVKQKMIPLIPVGHWGSPLDIAYGYLYLASDEAAYVNGICLTIDGGSAR
ncbi:MAG: 3-oxoacyl-ACP reductase FabG [Chitinophagaceae bacterium]|nr:3-oxoacyl-ACP reductase FabG [Chitinophagaceae bacterium]MCA6453240.1 3-oxoacyl-ACP reductase FabG [Chitinophagaceae bacterium]MCA6459720.1 3-oxoacyl-ACP reductase FabG [Chitinophagaceae bacterium]MCA6466253.1 3-oxoacyl-ACP reductase FabG [Chitinophagaceae bacterium]